jgi:hypothetical protein
MFLSSLTLCNTSLLLKRSVPLISILLQHHISKTFQVFLIYFPQCPILSTVQSHVPSSALY